jgi:hypothetical protein
MLNLVLDTYNEGFVLSKARLVLNDRVRFSSSTGGRVSAAGLLGNITENVV